MPASVAASSYGRSREERYSVTEAPFTAVRSHTQIKQEFARADCKRFFIKKGAANRGPFFTIQRIAFW